MSSRTADTKAYVADLPYLGSNISIANFDMVTLFTFLLLKKLFYLKVLVTFAIRKHVKEYKNSNFTLKTKIFCLLKSFFKELLKS